MDGFSLEKLDKVGFCLKFTCVLIPTGVQDGKPSLLEGLKPAMMPALVIGVQHDVRGFWKGLEARF